MQIKIDKSIYNKEVLLKTAYTFTDRAYIHLSQDDSSWIIEWTTKKDEELLPEEFENEAISQQLRFHLIESAGDIRKIILARAFASSIVEASEILDNPQTSFEESAYNANELDTEESILKGWFENNDSV